MLDNLNVTMTMPLVAPKTLSRHFPLLAFQNTVLTIAVTLIKCSQSVTGYFSTFEEGWETPFPTKYPEHK